MIFISYLFIFVCLVKESQSGSYVSPGFPTSIDTPWHDIHPKQINCQFTGGDASSYSKDNYIVNFFDEKKVVDKEEVTLCSVWIFETECYEHWYLTTDITHVRRPIHANLNDCITEISSNQLSISDIPDESYPDPECYWLRKYTATKRIVHLQKITIHFDHYTNAIIDHRLLGGKCDQKYCKGTSDHALIIRDSDQMKHCSNWKREYVYISDRMIKVHGSGVEYYIDHVCDLKFCGRIGKRLSHGLFMEVPDISAHWALKRTHPCSGSDTAVASDPTVARELNLEGDKEGYEAYKSCLEAKDVIVVTNKVTAHLLSQITPVRAFYQKGDIYRFFDGKLQAATGRYRALESYPPSASQGCLKGDQTIKCFSFKDWIFNKGAPQEIPKEFENKSSLLINGITLSSTGVFSYPSNWKWIQIQNHELEQMDPAPIRHFVDDHPIFVQKGVPEVKTVQTKKHFNITDLFSGAWYRKLVWSIIFIIIILFLILILYKMISVCCCRKEYASTAELRIDRNQLRSHPGLKEQNVF